MANWPDEERRGPCVSVLIFYAIPQWHLLTAAASVLCHTISFIHQQSTGSSEVNGITNSHVVQVLRHLPSLREGGVGVLVVHLETAQRATAEILILKLSAASIIILMKVKCTSPLLSINYHLYSSFFILHSSLKLIIEGEKLKFKNPKLWKQGPQTRPLVHPMEQHMFVLFCAHHLDHKVHVSLVLITGDWSVGPDHQSAIHLGRQVHVLTWARRSGGGGWNEGVGKVVDKGGRGEVWGHVQTTSLTSTLFFPHAWITKFYYNNAETPVENEKLICHEKRRVSVPMGSPRIWASDGRPNRNFFVSWLISCTGIDSGEK